MFMMSFFELSIGVLQKLGFYRSRFFWQGNASMKKYRLVRWDLICRPKDQGGHGIIDLEIQNKCLFSKWLFKLFNEDGIWHSLLIKKYLGSKTLSQVSGKPTDSHF